MESSSPGAPIVDDRRTAEVCVQLLDCLTFIRRTVDGILACTNTRGNVWNVFGGLNRTKKAVANILTNELRDAHATGNAKVKSDDVIMLLAEQLLLDYPCGKTSLEEDGEGGNGVLNVGEQMLMSWIEHHLLAHTLIHCLSRTFKSYVPNTDEVPDTNTVPNMYKEYAYMKNDALRQELLVCLEALQQQSMHLLSDTNSISTNKTTFLDEFTPWVAEKTLEEYKIQHRPPDLYRNEALSSSKTSLDNEQCDACVSTLHNSCMSDSRIRCKCRTKKRSPSTYSEEILLKSALCAAVSQNMGDHGTLGWYEEDTISMKSQPCGSDGVRSRLSRMKEISRSESSLLLLNTSSPLPEHRENKSDNDALDYDDDGGDDEGHDANDEEDEFSLNSFQLPRSSARVQKGHQRSKSDQVLGIQLDYEDGLNDSILTDDTKASSLPKEFTEQARRDSQTYFYTHEDGQLFPKPYEGQSLISYLESRSYDTGAQLDKENAHFSICEALITAIEQIRCQKMNQSESDDSSDEEIQSLKEKLRDRRWVRRLEKQRKDLSAFSEHSDTTTGKSSSFKTSSTLSSSLGTGSSKDEGEVVTREGEEEGNISDSWENLSMVSKVKSPQPQHKDDDDDDQTKCADEQPGDDYSAEAVAKCLLKKFDGCSIPAASELKWIVSEDEVPQQLLPLPSALPVNPDAHLQEESGGDGPQNISLPFQSLLRGNLEWAPPRPQIIFSSHPFVKRKVMLQRQHFRCAGCGLKVTPGLSKRFRYCEYLGKYFCTSCHQNKLSHIPSKILSKWDFKKYPVSDFAKELLKKIHRDPLFNVEDISPNLYKNVGMLSSVRNIRVQLHHMKNFINTCRHAQACQKEMSKMPMHIIEDPHSYSIDDFLNVKTGEMHATLKTIVSNGTRHITTECPLCSAKGFFCEFCRDGDDILYPFDLHKVSICSECKTCYHRHCYIEGKCAKCERIRVRKNIIKEPLADLLDSPTGGQES